MDSKEILQKIIDHDGSCNWILKEPNEAEICSLCPLSRLKKSEYGEYLSCLEAVCGDNYHDSEYKQYKDVAIRILMDILVDEELLGAKDEDYE